MTSRSKRRQRRGDVARKHVLVAMHGDNVTPGMSTLCSCGKENCSALERVTSRGRVRR